MQEVHADCNGARAMQLAGVCGFPGADVQTGCVIIPAARSGLPLPDAARYFALNKCTMFYHASLSRRQLASLIRSGAVTLGGYKKAGIYGLLRCPSGRRMKVANRVFFKNESEALALGYRPCGACMPEKYKAWKAGKNRVDDAATPV